MRVSKTVTVLCAATALPTGGVTATAVNEDGEF